MSEIQVMQSLKNVPDLYIQCISTWLVLDCCVSKFVNCLSGTKRLREKCKQMGFLNFLNLEFLLPPPPVFRMESALQFGLSEYVIIV